MLERCPVALTAVLIAILAIGESTLGSKVRPPVLNIKSNQHVILVKQTLKLTCSGKKPHSWSLPDSVHKAGQRLSIVPYRCGENSTLFCNSLTLTSTQITDTGFYRCKYNMANGTKRKRTETAVYVYIKDEANPFVKSYVDKPKVLYMELGMKLVIPCRVTAPDINVTLNKIPEGNLKPDGKAIMWDSREGFIIPNAGYMFIGLLSCKATSQGQNFTTTYLTQRQVKPSFIDLHLNTTGVIALLRGELLAINCTATTELNTRITFKWTYPDKAPEVPHITKGINQSYKDNKFYSALVINNVSQANQGTYTCHAESGGVFNSTKTTVVVHNKPFIKVKHKSKARAIAGQKSYTMLMKVEAFPPPEVVWLKDGVPAATQCVRYKVNGYTLTINDVTEEDAGTYTMMLRIQQKKFYKNCSVVLTVNVKPQICEKAVSFQNPTTYPLGSKQTLKCTAYGIPRPKFQWAWKPCPSNDCKTQCDSRTNARHCFVFLNTSSTVGNRIHSISERTELLQGKNKTVGILVVAESNVSGIYRCIAHNKIGNDTRDTNFYVTDVPRGFHIAFEQSPTEGEDMSLPCRANRFLYTDMEWHIPNFSPLHMMYNITSDLNGTSFERYSKALYLNIRNISKGQSGTYTCTARNLYTGKQELQQKMISIRPQEAPQLVHNLSDMLVNLSGDVALNCQAKGVPAPFTSWYKNNQVIQQAPGIILGQENSTLLIQRVKQEDEGLYECKVTNQKGAVTSSAYLKVQGRAENSNLEVITLTCTCVAATLFWLLLTLFIRKMKRPGFPEVKTDYLAIMMDPEEVPLDEQCECLPYDANKWEFPRERLKLGKSLGHGAFGKVLQATAFRIQKSSGCQTVAVKMLKEGATASEYKALMTELKILIHIGHHLNVVNLLGACTKQGGPLMVIVEYCKYGNLSNYLKSKRDVFVIHRDTVPQQEQMKEKPHTEQLEGKKKRGDSITSSESSSSISSGFDEDKGPSDVDEEDMDSDTFYKQPITMEDLISYSFQVARGMEFLSSRKCIHRDLAARNILLAENNVVKICDFGLARDIYKDPDYVRKGDARLPLKWMAPEFIFDKVYTTQSDVWSYGVLLWEIFSLGASPYPGVQIDEEFCQRLKEGTRMRAPEYATPEIYQTMLDCWQSEPKERPTFPELVKRLGDLLQANVQQDGKDYIPLNTILTPNSNFGCSSSESTSHCVRDNIPTSGFHNESFGSLGYVNTLKKNRPESVKTFDELSPKNSKITDDYQADSGIAMASEEFKRLTWTGCNKQKQLQPSGMKNASRSKESMKFTSNSKESVSQEAADNKISYNLHCNHIDENSRGFGRNVIVHNHMACCAPPPDYNSVVSYTSPPKAN
ncbi:vascular endothelial growth factor receptor 1 isoform X2 [Protopterus annectens]|uniref:vascular endothelial growth factor receptor 1 isoform X2 n=1 Tax=Protopterus annectens TaxID=7888 RepID=UPI001CFB382D|nr:vascular endothelial growth factor receptor 1 isoform X2 [Protopterus annectens]